MRRGTALLVGLAGVTVLGFAYASLPPVRTVGEREWRRAVAGDSVPQSILEAEAHGARHPRSTAAPTFPPIVVARPHVGTGERRCVDVGASEVVRAGDLMASPFATYSTYWHKSVHTWSSPDPRSGSTPKISWFGGHLRSGVPAQLVVRATRLDSAGTSYVYVSPTKTVSWGFAKLSRYAHVATFFDLPASGRWLLVATLDEDWGCLIYGL